jgi:hypothetical protein
LGPVRILLVATLWLGGGLLAGLASEVDTGVSGVTGLRRSLLIAPAAAWQAACAPPERTPPEAASVLVVCRRSLLWHTAAGWTDACRSRPPPLPWAPRRYEIRLACSWRLGPLAATLPLLRTTLFR